MAADELDPIILSAETDPTIFAPHEYVAIKAEMLAGDEIAVQNAMGKVNVSPDGKTTEIAMQIGDSQRVMVEQLTVGWQIDRKSRQPDGSVKLVPLEFSKANVSRLPRKIFNFVYQKMNELYNGEDATAQQNFSSGAPAPIAESSPQAS